MRNNTKQLYEKMVDFKRFAVALLTIGSFFYLGMIIPDETKSLTDLYIMTGSSLLFLTGSIYFFARSKHYRATLDEMGEGQDS